MSAPIGGQAVLEGVMMRGPSNWAVAVRKPNGQIAEVCRPIDSVMKRHRFFRLPVIRGVIALGESLAIGFRALAISASYAAAEDNEEAEQELSRGALVFAFLIAIGFAISLFKVGPALLADLLPISNGFWFVLVEGLIRVTVFVVYLFLISLLPDLRRVFQYHAAEHKAINAYEAGEELHPETVQRYSLIHPRCGTAFLLWVMLIAAAHATCLSMALSNGLAQEGHAPDELDTSATVTFQPGEGITKIALTVEGRVSGMDEQQFRQAAEQAKENCPVSKALAGVPEITLDAHLA